MATGLVRRIRIDRFVGTGVAAVTAEGKVGNPKLFWRHPATRRLASTSYKDIACGAFFQNAFGGDQIRFAHRFAHGFGRHSAHHFEPEIGSRSAAP